MSNKEGGGLLAKEHVWRWYEAHKAEFAPPVCNRLLHRAQLSVMFVGGPNTRTDYHLDQAAEFFYQLRGAMELPVVERGRRRVVRIGAGDVFLLPPRVPHSPQRPHAASLGLVVERRRLAGELDGLRYYTDFAAPQRVLWERYFQCWDLGRDLVPVVKAFHASEEKAKNEPSASSVVANPPFEINSDVTIPDPFPYKAWLEKHREALDRGERISLFGEDHPTREIRVLVCGGSDETAREAHSERFEFETCLYQHEGVCHVRVGDDGEWETLAAGECAVVPCDTPYQTKREAKSIGWQITQDPTADNPENRKRVDKEKADAAAKAKGADDDTAVAEHEQKRAKTSD